MDFEDIKCWQYPDEKFDLYIEHLMTQQEEIEFEDHIQRCLWCSEKLTKYLDMAVKQKDSYLASEIGKRESLHHKLAWLDTLFLQKNKQESVFMAATEKRIDDKKGDALDMYTFSIKTNNLIDDTTDPEITYKMYNRLAAEQRMDKESINQPLMAQYLTGYIHKSVEHSWLSIDYGSYITHERHPYLNRLSTKLTTYKHKMK